MSDMTVGALAIRTGLTVRTLHHYDALGLLRPSGRTHAGHRLYSDRDIVRLERIVLLRGIGLSLAEVLEALSGTPDELRQALETHAANARRRVHDMQTVADRLEHMSERLRTHQLTSIEEALSTIQIVYVFEKYFERGVPVAPVVQGSDMTDRNAGCEMQRLKPNEKGNAPRPVGSSGALLLPWICPNTRAKV